MAFKGLRKFFREWWRKIRRKSSSQRSRPLREFVYLDEVSLTSLLVSQRDTVPENVTSGRVSSEQAEVSSRASVDTVAAKAEGAARYQTANSSSVETSRKAVVQTLFNELRDDDALPIFLTDNDEGPVTLPGADEIRAWPAEGFDRGRMIEVEVVLDADPVFKLGTMVSEFSAMAGEYPDMAGPAGLEKLNEVEPVKKVLDRLLAGLIPIRARSCSFSVVTVDGNDFIVRSGEIAGLDLVTQPLDVVGVTEHLGYWKDIRRVLFSSGTFKLLCRVSRTGVHDSWTPVKVAHLFEDVAPTLVEKIDAAGRMCTSGGPHLSEAKPQHAILRALASYVDEMKAMSIGAFEAPQIKDLIAVANEVADKSSPSAQKQAFASVRRLIDERNPQFDITPEQDLNARQRARADVGLVSAVQRAAHEEAPNESGESNEADSGGNSPGSKVVDVEVVAIYW